MKYLFFIIALIFSLKTFSQGFSPDSSNKIIVHVQTLSNLIGELKVILFSSGKEFSIHKFDKAYRKKIIPADSLALTVVFDSIPPGKYGILVFQDEDSNDKFNYFNEDFVFSGGMLGNLFPHTFSRSDFLYEGGGLSLNLYLENEHARVSPHGNLWTGTPIFGYAPETNFLGGVSLIHLFTFKGADKNTRTSSADLLAAFTFNKQLIIEQNFTVFTNKEKYIITGNNIFKRFPQYYYGIGNNTPYSNKELISYNLIDIDYLILRRVYKKLFIGSGYRFLSIFNLIEKNSNKTLSNGSARGANGSYIGGPQIGIAWDSRDNIYNSYRGSLLKYKFSIHTQWLGSQFSYLLHEIDLRKFLMPFPHRKDILALQVYGYFTSGQTPWNELAALGGDMIMRGYYSGRFRDAGLLAAQIEYRLNLNKLFGIVAFAGTGEVFSGLNKVESGNFKPFFGGGLRFKLDRKQRLNLRLDYAVGKGKGNQNFYIRIAEAF